ncbi:unnamed protein product [Durusdinium trenchii]|uniref:Uncharacterized protein n=1 Tax=Durusdinium trenchii TaxID=1381693 RepID=A0ABP0KZX6_9DINO
MPGASEPRAHGSSTLQKEIRDTRKRKASSGSEKAEGNQQSQKAKDLPVEKAEGKKESCTEKMKDKDKDVSIMIEEDQERTKTQKEKEVPKLRKHGEQDEPKKEEDAQKLKNKQKSKSEKGEPKQAQHDNKQKKRKADTEPTEEKNELQKVKPKNERGKEDRKPTKAKKDEMDEERNRAEEKNDEVQQVEDGKDMKKAAQAFRGKYSVEGTLLPNADSEVPEDDAALSIDSRLGNRAQAKPSSKRLEQESSAGPGMYAKIPEDRTAEVAKKYHVYKSQDHLDAFQSVYRRLRRTGL